MLRSTHTVPLRLELEKQIVMKRIPFLIIAVLLATGSNTYAENPTAVEGHDGTGAGLGSSNRPLEGSSDWRCPCSPESSQFAFLALAHGGTARGRSVLDLGELPRGRRPRWDATAKGAA